MDSKHPLISCICITNNRIGLLRKSISYFMYQDYPNKELVISYPKNDRMTRFIIGKILAYGPLPFVVIERDEMRTLGSARNEAIALCNGKYVCNWDDDDWYHSTRLSIQFASIHNENFQASVLNRLILYDSTSEKAYLSFLYTWESSLMCRKDVMLINPYRDKDIGEDATIIDYLGSNKLIAHIHNAPHLYIYIYHRENTWNYSHFKYLFNRSELISEEVTTTIKNALGLV